MNHKIKLQNRCHERHQGLKSPVFTDFFQPLKLFPLDGCGGFTGDIVDDAVDAADLVDDAHRNAVENVIRNSCPVGGHEVGRCDAAQCQRIIIRPAIKFFTL